MCYVLLLCCNSYVFLTEIQDILLCRRLSSNLMLGCSLGVDICAPVLTVPESCNITAVYVQSVEPQLMMLSGRFLTLNELTVLVESAFLFFC